MKKHAINTFIGIDVSKDTLSVFSKTSRGNSQGKAFQVGNDPAALSQMERKLKSAGILLNHKTAVIFEHTGVYSRVLLNFLALKKAKIFMESGLRIKRSMGIQRGKTDNVDAQRIADFGMRNYDKLKCWEPRRPVVNLVRHLLTLRDRIKKNIIYFRLNAAEVKRFGSPVLFEEMNQLNGPALNGLNQSLKQIELRLNNVTAKDVRLRHYLELLVSIPQIGQVTALHLIMATNEFKLHTDSKTLACYCGVAPFEYSSGTSIKKRTRVNPASNRKIKSLLHLAALRSITQKGIFKKYYDRKLKEGKHKLVVLNAIRNKFVRRIAAVIARDTPYLPEREYRKQLGFAK